MDGNKNDEFREIDDKFNDIDNLYFPFKGDIDSSTDADTEGFSGEDLLHMAFGMSSMVGDLLNFVISVVPREMQEAVSAAIDAASSSLSGNAEESNKLLRKLRKLDKNNAGVYLREAKNYKVLAAGDMKKDTNFDPVYLKKEKKALEFFLKHEDDSYFTTDDDYMWARIEDAKLAMMLNGDYKGIFTAYIEIPDEDFDIKDIENALNEYYEDDNSEASSDYEYTFLSDSSAVISVRYEDPISMAASAEPELRDKFLSAMDELGVSNHAVSITVVADKSKSDNIAGAAFDFQQVLTAIWSLYSDSDLVLIYDYPFDKEELPLLQSMTRKLMFALPFLANVTVEEDGGRSIAVTHEARRWGLEDLGMYIDPDDDNPDLALLYNSFIVHLDKPLKDNDEAMVNGVKVRFTEKTLDDYKFLLAEEV